MTTIQLRGGPRDGVEIQTEDAVSYLHWLWIKINLDDPLCGYISSELPMVPVIVCSDRYEPVVCGDSRSVYQWVGPGAVNPDNDGPPA